MQQGSDSVTLKQSKHSLAFRFIDKIASAKSLVCSRGCTICCRRLNRTNSAIVQGTPGKSQVMLDYIHSLIYLSQLVKEGTDATLMSLIDIKFTF